ncbi:hypothetical protein MNBD_NITROSPINAE04-1270 [hydrothermal vent metagenome]|uniref:VTT domain-containing protein n=1 Tax=hydrothermal vent metagenome TaxID=652676 RepID=A0A3B1BSK0_9ZZZZ
MPENAEDELIAHEAPPSSKSPAAGAKLIVFAILVIAIIAIFKFTGVGYYFSREFISAFLDKIGAWAPVGFMAIYAVGTVLGVPGTILTILGGVIFGTILGTILVVTGATIGACGAFFVARVLARDFVEQKFGSAPWFKKFDEGIEREGLFFVLFVRLVPLFPFNGINFASGLTKVKFRDYLIGTAVGIIPGSFVFVYAASTAAEAATEGKLSPELFVALLLLGFLAIVPILYKKYKVKKETGKGEE